jgi:hypothetical protein
MSQLEVSRILEALIQVKEDKLDNSVVILRDVKNHNDSLDTHQFVTFLKPEVSDGPVEVSSVLELFFSCCQQNKIQIGGICISKNTRDTPETVIDQVYPFLAQVSYNGLRSLKDASIHKINEFFGRNLSGRSSMLGGDELLHAFPNLSAQSLQLIVDGSGVIKIGSGLYASYLPEFNSVVLNGFYPAQRNWLGKDGSVLIIFECRSQLAWNVIRREFIGSVFPELADKGSFRSLCFHKSQELKLNEISVSRNCIHISPSPFEAVRLLDLFFTRVPTYQRSKFEISIFAKNLIEEGIQLDTIESWLSNPEVITPRGIISLFDYSEDMDARALKSFLKELSFSASPHRSRNFYYAARSPGKM